MYEKSSCPSALRRRVTFIINIDTHSRGILGSVGAVVSCGPHGPRAQIPRLPYMASDATIARALLPQRHAPQPQLGGRIDKKKIKKQKKKIERITDIGNNIIIIINVIIMQKLWAKFD